MADTFSRVWAIVRAVLAVVGAAAVVVLGYIVVRGIRKHSGVDQGGQGSPGQVIADNSTAIAGLNAALDTLRNAWNRSNP